MRFTKTPEFAVLSLSRQDMVALWYDNVAGTRDGFYGPLGSKITVRSPSDRHEKGLLRNALAHVTLDAGQDILAIVDPEDQPQNGFVHHVPKDALVAASMKCDETPAVLPVGGLLFVVEPHNFARPSVWERVTDPISNYADVLTHKANWPAQPEFQGLFHPISKHVVTG
jgi:hypothetical protein